MDYYEQRRNTYLPATDLPGVDGKLRTEQTSVRSLK